MRLLLALTLVLSCCGSVFSQRPRLFTEKLGNHPQFPFLQYEKGITTRAAFLKAAKDPESRHKYPTEFAAFNRLLQDIGFTRGYKQLRTGNIENVFINPGTIGKLGFFNKENNYIYVKLNPAGEGPDGIGAWKITGPGGRYIHILHTCGNAFLIDGAGGGRPDCPCDTSSSASGKITPDPLNARDTIVVRDTIVKKDTVYLKIKGHDSMACHKKWEITLDGGASVNSIPRLNNTTQHTQTNGWQPAAELTVSRIFNHWFQAGISAGYFKLSYQDDYSGPTPNTWHTVDPARPVIPLQLFAKATIGGPLRWQANVSLSAGYGLVGSGVAKSGPTAGLKLGVAYFFNCTWGLGVSFAGQYFDNKAAAMNYHLMALPVTAGIRYRF
jgi:hypothetical protein